MKLGVFSDIHSNYHGFHACYEEAVKRGVNQFLFLGDYVSDCAYPEKTMELLYHIRDRYPCTFIRGNREDYLLNHKNGAEDGWVSPSSASGSSEEVVSGPCFLKRIGKMQLLNWVYE